MCGIFGFIGYKDDYLLKTMGECLSHRGPDDEDYFKKDLVNLGYRRLSIIDVKKSFQPLFNEDKSIVLLFNGEIYNFGELREKLSKHKFITDGDGETIIHWYEEHGPFGFKDLNGMFAFTLYDLKKGKVYLVRDHFGIKPLYYYAQNNQIIYASEIKAILKKIKARPNTKVIRNYLLTRAHDNTDETFFTGIKRIPFGSYLEWDIKTGKHTMNSFWSSPSEASITKEPVNELETINKFRELFLDSVKLRLISEVPVGTALSGGLDSSAVVCTVPNLKTFSAVFPGGVNNEEDYIDEVVAKTGVKAFKVYPKVFEFWQDTEKLISAQDEPMISTGPYAQWKVMEKARAEGIKVIIDGQGVDEMLAGYIPYHFVYFKELLGKKDYLKLIVEIIMARDLIIPLIKSKFKSQFDVGRLFPFTTPNNKVSNNLKSRLRKDLFYDSLPALLRYEDHNSMAFSIESRVPFLDYRLVEFVLSLPSNYIIRNGWNKWIMRQALKDLLPKKIATRRWKVGFSTPEVAWLRQSAEKIREIFQSKTFLSRPYFNHAKIQAAFEDFVSGKNDDSMVFWRIINVELWLRQYFDQTRVKI